jgi:hypothetical protein
MKRHLLFPLIETTLILILLFGQGKLRSAGPESEEIGLSDSEINDILDNPINVLGTYFEYTEERLDSWEVTNDYPTVHLSYETYPPDIRWWAILDNRLSRLPMNYDKKVRVNHTIRIYGPNGEELIDETPPNPDLWDRGRRGVYSNFDSRDKEIDSLFIIMNGGARFLFDKDCVQQGYNYEPCKYPGTWKVVVTIDVDDSVIFKETKHFIVKR